MKKNWFYMLVAGTVAVSILPESPSSEAPSFAVEHERDYVISNSISLSNQVEEQESLSMPVRGEKVEIWTNDYLAQLHFKNYIEDPPPGEGPNSTCGVAQAVTSEWAALLDTIGWAEGPDWRYNVLFGRGRFHDYLGHPAETGEMPRDGICQGDLCSTAAGRYQVNRATFLGARERGYFQDFTPKEQDGAAVHLAERRGVTQRLLERAVEQENFSEVSYRLRHRWTALSGEDPEELNRVYLQCYEVQRRNLRRGR